MNNKRNKIAGFALAAVLLNPVNALANSPLENAAGQGVLVGYGDGDLKLEKQVTRAELAAMMARSFHLKATVENGNGLPEKESKMWYYSDINTMLALGIMSKDGNKFNPHAPITHEELAHMTAKALGRDVMSLKYWMKDFVSGKNHVTRGETAELLVISQKSVRSEAAEIVEIKPLNNITLEVKFSSPLTIQDESLDAAMKNFEFTNGLSIVNQPRLKTGSLSTYIVPTTTQIPEATYSLNYKGKQEVSFKASAEKINMNEARQVSYDTFEIESLKADGVTDYGYVISAYSAGRGANAFILDENNDYGGQHFQIISSLRNRSVTITPEGGEPMVANYLGFTQSTDGKAEPKFRLPEGNVFQPGMKYTVSSDWTVIKQNTFVAGEFAPLTIQSVEQVDASTLNVALSEDPKDEMFASRQIKLIGTDGKEWIAEYQVQTRKGVYGTFAIENDGKLTAGVSYTIHPVGQWAVAESVKLTVK